MGQLKIWRPVSVTTASCGLLPRMGQGRKAGIQNLLQQDSQFSNRMLRCACLLVLFLCFVLLRGRENLFWYSTINVRVLPARLESTQVGATLRATRLDRLSVTWRNLA